MIQIAVIFGTRPEKIKLQPVVQAIQKKRTVVVLQTGQHVELLNSLGDVGDEIEHQSLKIDLKGLGLAESIGRMITRLGEELDRLKPRLVLVQGDTSSALAGAISARLCGIPVGHVEAGLRTFNDSSPWPEEMNRRLIGQIATLHFAPTEVSRQNLLREGADGTNIHVTGNTAVDVVQQSMRERSFVAGAGDRLGGSILVTLHRRESHGRVRVQALRCLMGFLDTHPEYVVRLFRHPNPQVTSDLRESGIAQHPRVSIHEPIPHEDLLREVAQSSFVVSDSGGIQEEAPSLQRTVFIARNETERPEAVDAGINFLAGAALEDFQKQFDNWLTSEPRTVENPYGDGEAGRKIAELCERFLADGVS